MNRPANTEKLKDLLTTEELLFIFSLIAITRNMKNKAKHLYIWGCHSLSKSRWALHEIPNIPVLNWSRTTEYFMLKRAIWGDLVWSPFPKWSHSECCNEFLTLILHVGNSELKTIQTQEIEQMWFWQTAIFKSNLRNKISSLHGHVPSFLSPYLQ